MEYEKIQKLVDVEFIRLVNRLTKNLMPPTYKCWIDNLIKMYEKGINDALKFEESDLDTDEISLLNLYRLGKIDKFGNKIYEVKDNDDMYDVIDD